MSNNTIITQILIKRGNTETISTYTGPHGELIFNTDDNSVYVQDGVTQGGHQIGANVSTLNNTLANLQTEVGNIAGITGNVIQLEQYFANVNLHAIDSNVTTLISNVTSIQSLISGNVGNITLGDGNLLLKTFPDGLGNLNAWVSTTNNNTGIYISPSNTNEFAELYLPSDTSPQQGYVGGAGVGGFQVYGYNADYQVNLVNNVNIVANSSQWTFDGSGNLTMPTASSKILFPYNTNSNAIIDYSQDIGQFFILQNNLADGYQAINLDTDDALVQISSKNAGGYPLRTWSFDWQGQMRFPDNTIQNTAYQGPAGQTDFATQANVVTANVALKGYVDNKFALLANAPAILDTLGQIATAIQADEANIGTLLTNITTSNANLAAANTKIATLQTQVYTNSNVASYLPTYTGNLTAGNLIVSGNINYIGNVNYITGQTGQFQGNAAGFGAVYAGILSGYTYQPQTVLQNSTNFNGYAQVNHQNINNGASASTDYVATADTGTAGAGYIDMGINSSGFVNGTGNELNYPLDGYLYAQGTNSTNGNLILGTGSTADIVFTTGGFSTTNNYQGRFKNNVGLILAQTTQSTSTTSGALQVSGGVGIVKDAYVGGNLFVNGTNVVSSINSINSNVTAANLNITNLQANIGSFYTYANLNYGTSSYANANVIGYLAGNITIGNATATSFRSNNFLYPNGVSILTGIGGTYSNSNVASYLLGNITTGNVGLSIGSWLDFRTTDQNWRIGYGLGAYTKTTAQATVDVVVGQGSAGPDGFTVGQTGGASIFELVGYTRNAWFANNVTVVGNVTSGNVLASGFFYANGTPFTSSSYGNTQVAAYLVANPQTGTYSNSNVASYLVANPQSGTYSNTNVSAYLTTATISTTGNITAGNIITTGALQGGSGTQGIALQPWTGGGSYAALYSTAITPANGNYSILVNGTSTWLNAGSGGSLFFRINNQTAPTAFTINASQATVGSIGTANSSAVNTQTLVVAGGGLGVTGSSYFSNTLGVGGNLILSNTSYVTSTTGSNGNITLDPDGTGQVSVVGSLTATGNITAGNLTTSGTYTVANITTTGAYGNITGANVISANTLQVSNGIFWANGVAWSSSGGTTYSNANVVANLANFVTNISTTANITTTANIISPNYLFANGVNILSTVTGGSGTYSNTNVSAYLTTATISTTGNITGGNLITAGNVYGANFVGNITTGANITASYFITSGAYGNISQVNTISANNYVYANGVSILTGIGGTYSNTNVAAYLTGNITSGNISTNILTANVVNAGTLIGNLSQLYNGGYTATLNSAAGNGTLEASYLLGDAAVLSQGSFILTYAGVANKMFGMSMLDGTDAAIQGTRSATLDTNLLSFNITTGNVTAIGNIGTVGNVTSNYHYANVYAFANGVNILSTITSGSTYSNTNVAAYLTANPISSIANGGSSVAIASSGGNAVVQIGGVSTATFSQSQLNVIGNIIASANIQAANIIANQFGNSVGTTATYSGNITAAYFTGNGVALTGLTYNNIGNIYGSSSNVTVQAGSYSWTFDNTGNLTIPTTGNIYFANGTQFSSGSGGGTTYSNANVVSMLSANTAVFIGNTGVIGNVATGNIQANATAIFLGANTVISNYGSPTFGYASHIGNNIYFDANGVQRYRNTQTGASDLMVGPGTLYWYASGSAVTANAATGWTGATGAYMAISTSGMSLYNGAGLVSSGPVTIQSATGLVTNQSTIAIFNGVGTTINMGGAATTTTIGASNGITVFGANTGAISAGTIIVNTNFITNGNVTANAGGSIVSTGNSYTTGNTYTQYLVTTGNSLGNISGVNNLTAVTIQTTGTYGNITGANVVSANTFVASGNVTAANIIANQYGNSIGTTATYSGNVTASSVIASGSSGPQTRFLWDTWQTNSNVGLAAFTPSGSVGGNATWDSNQAYGLKLTNNITSQSGYINWNSSSVNYNYDMTITTSVGAGQGTGADGQWIYFGANAAVSGNPGNTNSMGGIAVMNHFYSSASQFEVYVNGTQTNIPYIGNTYTPSGVTVWNGAYFNFYNLTLKIRKIQNGNRMLEVYLNEIYQGSVNIGSWTSAGNNFGVAAYTGGSTAYQWVRQLRIDW